MTDDELGTFGVSRGMTAKSANQKFDYLQQKRRSASDKELIAKYNADHQQKDRLDEIQKDTAVPTHRMSDYQKRSMRKRMNRKDKSVHSKLQIRKTRRYEAAVAAADAQIILNTEQAGFLEPEHEMEFTSSLSQVELKRNHLDENTARHIYDLALQSGPYGCKFDRSGRYSILYGQRGHLAIMDAHNLSLHNEFHVRERVRDSCFLHNFSLLAVAQTNHVYIYDDTGAEVHKLSDHHDPMALDFLPYHWLLASVGRTGHLIYQDTSTGGLVSQQRTKLGPCNVLRQNPSNAIINLGHSNGTVTLWSPSSNQYMAKMHCHKGAPITSMAIDISGNYMATGGADRQIKIWDLRKFKCTHSYFSMAGIPSSLDISQQRVLGVGHAGHVTLWSPEALVKKVKEPYMRHSVPACGPIETIRFRPFEDVCTIGHSKGIASIIVPGSGEPNLDTTEYNLNPFQDKKQQREAEVRALLDKLDHGMITMDSNEIGGMEESTPQVRASRLKDAEEEANAHKKPKRQATKKRGRSKIQTQLRRKQRNVVDKQVAQLREAREKEKEMEALTNGSENGYQRKSLERAKDEAPAALKRFF